VLTCIGPVPDTGLSTGTYVW